MGDLYRLSLDRKQATCVLRFAYPGRNSREYSPQKNREAPVSQTASALAAVLHETRYLDCFHGNFADRTVDMDNGYGNV